MQSNGYLLGIDVGSSSVKASLVEVKTGKTFASAQSPAEEMPMLSLQPGWAEQDPEMWWEHVIKSVKAAFTKSEIDASHILAIGISYQMHGLVVVDKYLKPLRPSIIWCDSRAVGMGEKAFNSLGENFCLNHYLNSPGNFTAAKLKWVKEMEPALYNSIYKVMLPGDYIAMKMSGETFTTDTGLSEGIFWDYKENRIAFDLLMNFEINEALLSTVVPVFSKQGTLNEKASRELGLKKGTVISYRAGDQPNNAFSLNVLNPGETAATAGTSGVIYSVTDQNVFDIHSRVNTFIHVNNELSRKRNGVLLCVNGTGILNSWMRKNIKGMGASFDYTQMNDIAAVAPIGAGGLSFLPFGNGVERILQNRSVQSSIHGLDFNNHTQSHFLRAAQEGIVFALKYGFEILQDMGLKSNVIRAGYSNMFLSPLFREAFVNTTGATLELYDTDGAKGAALGAGIGAGIYGSFEEAFQGLHMIESRKPESALSEQYSKSYDHWKQILNTQL
ncbi:MAG: carbohydrate kinase [Cyclobacteriaceae bacterium]|nr:carbohydrate kinase [Cyclobacteriaceae bacterium]